MSRVRELLLLRRSPAVRSSGLLFAGDAASALAGLVMVSITSRHLGAARFGVLAQQNLIVALLVGITDLGLATATLKLVGERRAQGRGTEALLRVVVMAECAVGLLVLALGGLFAGRLAGGLSGESIHLAVVLAVVSGSAQSALAFVGPFLAAHGLFFRNAALTAAGAAARLVVVSTLIATGHGSLRVLLVASAVLPVLTLLVGVAMSPRGWLRPSTRAAQRAELAVVVRFSRWILLSYVATTIASRVDVLLVSRYRDATEVGVYAAALQLVLPLPLLVGAVSTVLLPRIAGLDVAGLQSYLRQTAPLTAGLGAVLLLPLLVAGPVLRLVYGAGFGASTTPFTLLYLAYLVALVTNPLSIVVYARDRPQWFTAVNAVQAVLGVGLDVVLVPRAGAVGAAVVFLVCNTLGGLAGAAMAWHLTRSPAPTERSPSL